MIDIVIATLASATPMGQQEYEQQLARHFPSVAPELSFREVRVRSLRSSLPGEARLPLRAVPRLPQSAQHLVARMAYGPGRLVHRCDLRLPPGRVEVVTVHDLAPLRFVDEGELAPNAAASLRRARAVICPSQFAVNELAELLDVHGAIAIPNGLDPSVWDVVPETVLDGLGLPERFVLHSGGATERKNLRGLAGAWRRISSHHPDVGLVLCGPHDDRRTKLFRGLPRVQMLGRVPRETHLALMSAATVVVVPSTYEGFGFPALEAMARGTPVVAADSASLPEVCGDAAMLAQPSVDGIANAVDTILTDEASRTRLAGRGPAHARTFSWQRCADEHAAVYRRAMKGS